MSKDESLSDLWRLKQRAKRDSDRHRELVDRAIKKHGKDLISEYDMIKSDGNKKIKVPVRYLDKYRFKYGKMNNEQSTGQGLSGKPGDKYKIGNQQQEGEIGKAGNQDGEEVYEAEITIDELVNIMIKELNLPWLDPKKSSEIETESETLNDRSKKGSIVNLDVKKSLMENLKRNAAKGSAKIGPFANEDLRFKRFDVDKETHSNAAVYIMMDRSGSMDREKTKIAKTFYFWMTQFLKKRYKKIEFVFIAHDVKAFIVDEHNFFAISASGGTQCSSAFKLAYEHIKQNHPPDIYCNYVFEFSDGDNYGEDNQRCLEYIEKLMPLVKAMGYGEILIDGVSPWIKEADLLSNLLKKNINRTRFVSMQFKNKDDVYDGLKKFFNVDGKKKSV